MEEGTIELIFKKIVKYFLKICYCVVVGTTHAHTDNDIVCAL